MKKLETTLLLLRKDDEVLLAMKKRGFGEGNFNGVGGKLKDGESPEQAMIRETEEEIGIIPINYEKVGILDFIEFYKGEKENVVVHLYTATEWNGEIKESEEMRPRWFNINEVPYDKMFPDDKHWLPILLEGKKFNAFFEFDEEWNPISKKLEEI